MKRILALDIGTVRIGVAVSDPLGMFAQGIAVLKAESDWKQDISDLIKQYGVSVILLGLPTRTDGSEGPEVLKIKDMAKELGEMFCDVEIAFEDERFTTAIAERALLEADVSRKGRKQKVDKIAAALMLQSYLDRRRP